MKRKTVAAAVKAVAGKPGVYDAFVAVFGNVDMMGDRIIPGAFAASLDRWEKSGDPIPVLFSHRWDDLDAHIGIVEKAEEVMPGDQSLPPELRSLGGLRARMSLDIEDPTAPYAKRVATLLDRRSLKEFSFAYDVVEERTAADGANELVILELGELGPCLRGANPATVLLGRAKSLDDELDLYDRAVKALDALGTEGSTPATGDGNTMGGQDGSPEAGPGSTSEAGDGNEGQTGDGNGDGGPDAAREAERARLEAELELIDL